MKRTLILFVLLAMVAVSQKTWADEWYTVKDEISGGINFRSEPNLNSEILDCMILHNFFMLFRYLK